MDNYLKAVFFEHPDYIPVSFRINGACWHHYPKEVLWELMESHPALFPGFERPGKDREPDYAPCQRAGAPYTDPMGCVWETYDDGITGLVTGHPLADLSAFGTTWHFPDPEKCDGLDYVDRDRQRITPRGTPEQIDALIREEVEKLACPDGGLATGTALLGRFGGSDSPPDCHSVPPHPRVPDVGAPGGQQKNKFDECG